MEEVGCTATILCVGYIECIGSGSVVSVGGMRDFDCANACYNSWALNVMVCLGGMVDFGCAYAYAYHLYNSCALNFI